MYIANEKRYEEMKYNRCGASGLKLSEMSLGFWHNFGTNSDYKTTEDIVKCAFDNGITSFDLANNYGPIYGSAEERFGEILKNNFLPYREEMVISSKAGYDMWPGPYGEGGSKKYLISSCNQSLKRMGLEYVDIFYHHCPDPNTPLYETMEALAQLVRSGKALYVAISNYPLELAIKAKMILETEWNISPILNQVSYSILNRENDDRDNLFLGLENNGIGTIVFSPLAQGLLTDKYLSGNIPENCRARENKFLSESDINEKMVKKLNALNDIAASRGQSLTEMALTWILSKQNITSVIVGARNKEQLSKSLSALKTKRDFSAAEDKKIIEIASL